MDNISSLMFDMVEHDVRMCFALDLSTQRLLYVNNAFKRFFDSSHLSFSLKYLLSLVHEEDINILLTGFKRMMHDNFKEEIELRLNLGQNRLHYIKLNLHLSSINPKLILTGYFEDISTYKEEYFKLRRYANSKSAVSNILAHDLAGPLGNIQMFSKFIAKDLEDNKVQDTYELVKDIEKISDQGLNLIQDYVKGEFLESANGPLTLNDVDLVKPLSDLVEKYQETVRNRLSIQFHSSHESILTRIDEQKFLQAIGNLVSNAIKFTPEGGEIQVLVSKQDKTILISVSDNGVGISKKHHANLFEKFNTARRPGLQGQPSVGLGMSIIKTIVEWHRGKIWFDSQENSGTTFYIELKADS